MTTHVTSSTQNTGSQVYKAVIAFFAHHKTYTAFLFVIISVIVFYAMFSSPVIQKEQYVAEFGPIKQYVKATAPEV